MKKQKRDPMLAHKAWELWVEPLTLLNVDLADLAHGLPKNNLVGIDVDEIKRLRAKVEDVLVPAWRISAFLDSWESRAKWDAESAERQYKAAQEAKLEEAARKELKKKLAKSK